MPYREYWMVEFSKPSRPICFKFCESEQEAKRKVEDLKREGYRAKCWEM